MLPSTSLVLAMALMGFCLSSWLYHVGFIRLWALAQAIALLVVLIFGVISMVLVMVLVSLTYWFQVLHWEFGIVNAQNMHFDFFIYPTSWLRDLMLLVLRHNNLYIVQNGVRRRFIHWFTSNFTEPVYETIQETSDDERGSVLYETASVDGELAYPYELGDGEILVAPPPPSYTTDTVDVRDDDSVAAVRHRSPQSFTFWDEHHPLTTDTNNPVTTSVGDWERLHFFAAWGSQPRRHTRARL